MGKHGLKHFQSVFLIVSVLSALHEKCLNLEFFCFVFSLFRAKEVNIRIQSEYDKIQTRKYSEFEHLLRSNVIPYQLLNTSRRHEIERDIDFKWTNLLLTHV